MLEVVDIEYIRKKYFIEGWSIRKINRQLGYARQTIRKALVSAQIPTYELQAPRPCPVMDPYREVILNWLKQDENAPKKQRHTAKRIYDRLVEEYGFHGNDSTVRKFVRKLRQNQEEVFIPLIAQWGEQAQVDWGYAKVILNGKITEVCLFCLRLKASQVPFVRAFPSEKLESFLEGHVHAFTWLGGIPWELVYDNPKTAVVKVLSGPKRSEHLVFTSLRAHYLFDSIFCQPGKGNQKGSVENLVGYARRNAMVPLPEVKDLDQLNEILLSWCEKERDRLKESWEKEQTGLRPLPPHPFRCSVTSMVKVNNYSLVNCQRVRYSVPSRYVKQQVRLEAFSDRIEVWHKGVLIAEHKRSYCRKDTVLKLEHYLDVLEQKPRAVMHAAVVRQLPEIYQKVKTVLLKDDPLGYKELCRILLLHREYPKQEVESALVKALAMGTLTQAMVRQLILNHRSDGQAVPKVEVPEAFAVYEMPRADTRRYDLLLEVTS